MVNFVLKFSNFRYHGNWGRSELNFTDTILLADPENPILEPKITTLSFIEPELWRLKVYHYGNRNFFEFSQKNALNIIFYFSHPQKALPCAEPRHLTY